MAAKGKKDTLSDSCPKQEITEESCDPCGSTECEAESETGCDTCQ